MHPVCISSVEFQSLSKSSLCSVHSLKDNPLLTEDSSLGGRKHLSKSNIDISEIMEDEEPRQLLPRKQSDSSTYNCDTITNHHAFLSR